MPRAIQLMLQDRVPADEILDHLFLSPRFFIFVIP
jgi:hypothetical protein